MVNCCKVFEARTGEVTKSGFACRSVQQVAGCRFLLLLVRRKLCITLFQQQLTRTLIIASRQSGVEFLLYSCEASIRVLRAVTLLRDHRFTLPYHIDQKLGNLIEADIANLKVLTEDSRSTMKDSVSGLQPFSESPDFHLLLFVQLLQWPRCRSNQHLN
jgi:hypothetical protein